MSPAALAHHTIVMDRINQVLMRNTGQNAAMS